jgi:hypothetical protein
MGGSVARLVGRGLRKSLDPRRRAGRAPCTAPVPVRAALVLACSLAAGCGVGELTNGGPGGGGGDASDDPADGGGPQADGGGDAPFSFFVTSLEAMRQLSGSQDGFGGDLGGLTGADSICQQIAAGEGFGSKTWRAFISTSAEDAIDRIGDGPWYDRNGRLVANDPAGLLGERPAGDAQVAADLPNERGEGQQMFGDNHDVMTASNAEGRFDGDDPSASCQDWTSAIGPGSEQRVRAGHSWPSQQSGVGWIEAHFLRGCAPGVNLEQNGGGVGDCVGCSGGYGAIYCFALTP